MGIQTNGSGGESSVDRQSTASNVSQAAVDEIVVGIPLSQMQKHTLYGGV